MDQLQLSDEDVDVEAAETRTGRDWGGPGFSERVETGRASDGPIERGDRWEARPGPRAPPGPKTPRHARKTPCTTVNLLPLLRSTHS